MQKYSYSEFCAKMREHSEDSKPLRGVIVFTEGSFSKEYSLESRSYEVYSDAKAFSRHCSGYSIFGSALDGSDSFVRLEAYMKEERGGPKGWVVDYCYFPDGLPTG